MLLLLLSLCTTCCLCCRCADLLSRIYAPYVGIMYYLVLDSGTITMQTPSSLSDVLMVGLRDRSM